MSNELSIPLVDRRVLDLSAYGFSPAEIGDKTGLPPMVVIQKVKSALNDRNVYTHLEQKELLLHMMRSVLQEVREVLDPSDPKSVGAVVQVMRAVMDLLDKQKGFTEDEIREAAKGMRNEIARVVEAGFDEALEFIRLNHPDVDTDTVEQVFYEGLINAGSRTSN